MRGGPPKGPLGERERRQRGEGETEFLVRLNVGEGDLLELLGPRGAPLGAPPLLSIDIDGDRFCDRRPKDRDRLRGDRDRLLFCCRGGGGFLSLSLSLSCRQGETERDKFCFLCEEENELLLLSRLLGSLLSAEAEREQR